MSSFLQAMRQRLLATTSAVTSVNGQIGDVVVDVPVTSVNGLTGDVIITPPVLSVNTKTGAVDLSYKDVAGGKVASVTDYGATCDASTDDTTAVNAALAAINAGTISALFFPGFCVV